MDNNKLWDIIDELRRENNELKKDISHDSRVNQEYDDKYIAKINELEQENEKLKIELDAFSNLHIENKELRTKLNERVSCKDYESEGR